MIAKMLLAAIVAGVVAGALMTGVQQLRLVPLIVHAEVYEHGGHDHAAADARPAHGSATPAKRTRRRRSAAGTATATGCSASTAMSAR